MKRARQLSIVWLIVATGAVWAGIARGESFNEMRETYEKMIDTGESVQSADAVVVAWLGQCNIESLSDTGQILWLAQWIRPRGVRSNHFSVQWTGTLQVPADGAYTFSTCPITVNLNENGSVIWQTLAAWVGQEQVFSTAQGDWLSRGAPVTLTAGAKLPIRVEYSYDATGMRGSGQPAIAQLLWEGPGVAREILPSTVLTTTSGAVGLDAQYQVTVDGQQQAFQQVEPTIDQFWMEEDPVVPADGQLYQQLAARLAGLVTDPAYLTSCESKQATMITSEVRLLNSAQKRALIQAILARPEMVQRLPPNTVLRLYGTCRAAAPQEALDMLGQLTQGNADIESLFGDKTAHLDYWVFGKIAWQDALGFARLEQRYLVVGDGKCCLPVAYVVAYGYWTDNRLEEWIGKLDSRLADASVTGDNRVNWLLARAVAEALRGSRPGRGHGPQERFLAGRAWMEEACLAAQSEPVRLRAYKELAVRLVGDEQIEAATTLVDTAASRLSEPASTAALATWRTQIAGVAEKLHQQQAQNEAAAKDAYIQTLRSRRQRAIDQGNDQSAAQYEQMLKDAGAEVN